MGKKSDSLRNAITAILASLACIVVGLIIGLIILLLINPEHALQDGFVKIVLGGFNNIANSKRNLGSVIAQTAALTCTGLSVAFAFRTGLFNIGAAGQYTLGAFGALFFSLVLGLPWYICLLAAAVFGALWGAIPGLLKAYFNVNEVITAIMFNWIGLYAVNEIVKTNAIGRMYDATKNKTYVISSVAPQSVIPDLGLNQAISKTVTIAIFLAIVAAVVIWVLLNKTTFGYELKACGFNKNAAKYAGINDKKNIVLAMMIAGALAGLGAGFYYLSGVVEWNPNDSTALPAMGFNGIPAALLAGNNPIGVIFSAALISHIAVGGSCLSTAYYQPEIADIIIGVIIYFCAFALLIKGVIANARAKRINNMAAAEANAKKAQQEVTNIVVPGLAPKEGEAAGQEMAPEEEVPEETTEALPEPDEVAKEGGEA